jgi:hypothetical protein
MSITIGVKLDEEIRDRLKSLGSTLGGLIKKDMRQRLNIDAEMVGNRLGGYAEIAPVY